eukprot:1813112-Amphidinium_carterae.2
MPQPVAEQAEGQTEQTDFNPRAPQMGHASLQRRDRMLRRGSNLVRADGKKLSQRPTSPVAADS